VVTAILKLVCCSLNLNGQSAPDLIK
jgi:hypothetical protein